MNICSNDKVVPKVYTLRVNGHLTYDTTSLQVFGQDCCLAPTERPKVEKRLTGSGTR